MEIGNYQGNVPSNRFSLFKNTFCELLKEEKTISKITSEYGVHASLLHRWKKEFLEKAPQVFQSGDDTQKAVKAHQKDVEDLYKEIGRLTTQLS